MEFPSQDESQQIILKRNLINQFNRNELQPMLDRFVNRLVQDNPSIEKNPTCIVDYLVDRQRNVDELIRAIVSFLQIADEFSATLINIELAKDLLAYLLQTLVNESEVSIDGVNRVSVNLIPTIKLLYAAQKGIAVIPDYDVLEYKAGKRNARFENIGNFQSRNARWTVESVCEEIAETLLKMIHVTPKGSFSCLRTLKGLIFISGYDSTKSPLHGIFIESEYLKDHPFNNPHVVQHFMEITGGKLPIYIYSKDRSLNEHQNLKIDEAELMGLLSSEYELLKKDMDRQSASNISTEISTEGVRQSLTINKVDTLNINQNNYITLSKNAIEELQLKVPQLKQEIEIGQADISKKDYGEITRAVRILEEAMENQGKIEKDKIGELQRAFELYKDVLSLPASITSILSFILTHLS